MLRQQSLGRQAHDEFFRREWPGHFRYSTFIRIMPSMEQGVASNAMNFQVRSWDLNSDDKLQNTTRPRHDQARVALSRQEEA
jgi:hypothetical protein